MVDTGELKQQATRWHIALGAVWIAHENTKLFAYEILCDKRWQKT